MCTVSYIWPLTPLHTYTTVQVISKFWNSPEKWIPVGQPLLQYNIHTYIRTYIYCVIQYTVWPKYYIGSPNIWRFCLQTGKMNVGGVEIWQWKWSVMTLKKLAAPDFSMAKQSSPCNHTFYQYSDVGQRCTWLSYKLNRQYTWLDSFLHTTSSSAQALPAKFTT